MKTTLTDSRRQGGEGGHGNHSLLDWSCEMIVDILGWMIIGTILVIAGYPLFDMLSGRRKRRACKNDPTTRWLAYWEAQRVKEISQLRLILTEIELVRDRNKKAPATDRGSD